MFSDFIWFWCWYQFCRPWPCWFYFCIHLLKGTIHWQQWSTGPCFGKGIKARVHASRRLWKLRQNVDIDQILIKLFRNYGHASIEVEGIVFVTKDFRYRKNFNATPQQAMRTSEAVQSEDAWLGNALVISIVILYQLAINWHFQAHSKALLNNLKNFIELDHIPQ